MMIEVFRMFFFKPRSATFLFGIAFYWHSEKNCPNSQRLHEFVHYLRWCIKTKETDNPLTWYEDFIDVIFVNSSQSEKQGIAALWDAYHNHDEELLADQFSYLFEMQWQKEYSHLSLKEFMKFKKLEMEHIKWMYS